MKRCTLAIVLFLCMILTACGSSTTSAEADTSSGETKTETPAAESSTDSSQEETGETTTSSSQSSGTFTVNSVPSFTSYAYTEVNGNEPYFTDNDLTTSSFEKYSSLDSLGRCGVAYSNICKEIMPTEKRGSIGQVKPSGWHTVKYDFVDGKYLYNRCHLIGYQLAGENANEKNLITGTRYLNVEGMLPFENMVADYVKETNNHVLYRVTPIFEGNNLVASGVLMEAKSVEDKGDGVSFCVYCYNDQPGVTIDYSTGESSSSGGSTSSSSGTTTITTTPPATESSTSTSSETSAGTYILNTNSKKFHLPSCSSVSRMKESNKKEFTGTRDEAIAMGYSPCGICNP